MFNPIEMRRRMVQERIEKSFDNEIEKAHKDGDMHPNGKWVWVSSAAGGKGDWRTINGRAHQKHNAAQGSASGGNTPKDNGYAEKFKKNFKDASDDVLNKVISGKIQGTDADKRLAKEILDERKSSAEGEKSAKKIIDLLKVSSSKYSDIKKVTAFKTDKGNWAIDYDGANTGIILNGSKLSEKGLKAAGVKIEGANANSKKDSDLINDIKSNEDAFIDACGLSNIKRVVSIRETPTSVFIKYENESGQEQEFPITKNVANSVLKEVKSGKSKKTDPDKNGKWVTTTKMPGVRANVESMDDESEKSAEEKKGEKVNQTLTTNEKYQATSLARKIVGNEYRKAMKMSDIFKTMKDFSDAQVSHFAISAVMHGLNADGADERNEYLRGAKEAMRYLKHSRKNDSSMSDYLNTAFDGYSVGGSLDDDKKKELDKFVDSSNYMKKSGLEKQLDDATPEELKYIMVRAIEDKISSSKSGNMEGINHIIQEGIHKIKENNDLGDDYMISWNMLLDKDSEKPKNGSSKSDNSSENPFSKYEDNGNSQNK